jgi:hypothetical protein
MTSEAQIAANQQNAQLSTGPKTEEGKKLTFLNARKHGFAGQIVVIPIHEAAAFDEHFKAFVTEYKPKGRTEEFLVQSLAEISWSVQQIRAQSTNLMTLAGQTHEPTIDMGDPDANSALAVAGQLLENAKQINLLGIYEQRKMRNFKETRKELKEIQAERKEVQRKELIEASDFRKMELVNRKPGEPEWNPAEDGFVCSVAEIDAFLRRHKRSCASTKYRGCQID